MKKADITTKADFKLSDYDYMDDLPLDLWIWEFLRRNKNYRAWYSKVLKFKRTDDNRAEYHKLLEEYEEHYAPINPQCPDDRHIHPVVIDPIKSTKLTPLINVINLGIGFNLDAKSDEPSRSELPPIIKKTRKDGSSTYSVGNYVPVIDSRYTYRNKDDNTVLLPIQLHHPIEVLYQYQGRKNIMMALIDISAPGNIDKILKDLKSELLIWREALKLPKTRDAKTLKRDKNRLVKNAKIWKSYIIIYDLHENGMSFEAISNQLLKYDLGAEEALAEEHMLTVLNKNRKRQKALYASEKRIERQYKKAAELINGGYKKHL